MVQGLRAMLALLVNDAQMVLEHSGYQLSINETSSAAVVDIVKAQGGVLQSKSS